MASASTKSSTVGPTGMSPDPSLRHGSSAREAPRTRIRAAPSGARQPVASEMSPGPFPCQPSGTVNVTCDGVVVRQVEAVRLVQAGVAAGSREGRRHVRPGRQQALRERSRIGGGRRRRGRCGDVLPARQDGDPDGEGERTATAANLSVVFMERNLVGWVSRRSPTRSWDVERARANALDSTSGGPLLGPSSSQAASRASMSDGRRFMTDLPRRPGPDAHPPRERRAWPGSRTRAVTGRCRPGCPGSLRPPVRSCRGSGSGRGRRAARR